MAVSGTDAKRRTTVGSTRLAVADRKISELQIDPRNPRIHDAKQIRQIARSIRIFGFNVPVLVDGNLKVVAGHGRILAAQQLGLAEVPVIRLEHLTEAQARAFMLADNRLTENSVWDDRLLAEQLKALSEIDLDFDLEATGFEMAEIDLRIEGLDADSDEAGLADEIPEKMTEPISRRGDLWILGHHRLYCGSALDSAAYATVMEGRKAAMVFTDPPYNVPIVGNVSGNEQHREFAMGAGEMTTAEFTAFLNTSCSMFARFSVDGSLHFICMDWRHIEELMKGTRGVYSELKNLCVWVKDNAGMGSLYRSQHEFIFVFKNGTGAHRNNVQLGQFGRNRTNVWTYPGAASFSRSGEEGNLLEKHPTVKNAAMVADAIMDVSARGDTVLDAFLGAGTTIIAAERTGRRCCGIEIDPLYIDVAVRRWQTFTRDRARHAVTGRFFDEVEKEVRREHAE